MCHGIQNESRCKEGIYETGEKMNIKSLPEKMRKDLEVEALEWEENARRETEEAISKEIEGSELFSVPRPPRRPVSVRLDIRDISLLKRLSRRRGITYSQLIVQWLHERLDAEYRAEH